MVIATGSTLLHSNFQNVSSAAHAAQSGPSPSAAAQAALAHSASAHTAAPAALSASAANPSSQANSKTAAAVAPRSLASFSTEELLCYFKTKNPECPIHKVETFESLGKMLAPSVYPFEAGGKKFIAKFTSSSAATVIAVANALFNFPKHKSLNHFEGIVTTNDGKHCGLVFDRVNGNTLDQSQPSGIYTKDSPYAPKSFADRVRIATEILEALIHLEDNNAFHDDVASRNIMLSVIGKVVVIDYDYPVSKQNVHGRPPEDEETKIKMRWHFGWILGQLQTSKKEFQALSDKCKSNANPFSGEKGFGWESILKELQAIPKPSACGCTIM